MTKKYKFRYQGEIYREYSGGYNPEVDWWVMASSEDAAFSKLLRRARQNYGPDADIDETLIKAPPNGDTPIIFAWPTRLVLFS